MSLEIIRLKVSSKRSRGPSELEDGSGAWESTSAVSNETGRASDGMLSLGRRDSSTTVDYEPTPARSTRRDLRRSTSIGSPLPRNRQQEIRFNEVQSNELSRRDLFKRPISPPCETESSSIVLYQGLYFGDLRATLRAVLQSAPEDRPFVPRSFLPSNELDFGLSFTGPFQR